MITVIFGTSSGWGDALAEWIGCETSVEIDVNNVKEMIECLVELYPKAKEVFIYEHLAERITPPFIIKLNNLLLRPTRDVHKAQFENGDVVLISSIAGGVGSEQRELMQELIKKKREIREDNATS